MRVIYVLNIILMKNSMNYMKVVMIKNGKNILNILIIYLYLVMFIKLCLNGMIQNVYIIAKTKKLHCFAKSIITAFSNPYGINADGTLFNPTKFLKRKHNYKCEKDSEQFDYICKQ